MSVLCDSCGREFSGQGLNLECEWCGYNMRKSAKPRPEIKPKDSEQYYIAVLKWCETKCLRSMTCDFYQEQSRKEAT